MAISLKPQGNFKVVKFQGFWYCLNVTEQIVTLMNFRVITRLKHQN